MENSCIAIGLKRNKCSAFSEFTIYLSQCWKNIKKETGSIFSITYNNSNTTSFSTRREFEEQQVDIIKTVNIMIR